MKVTYNPDKDTLTIAFKDELVVERHEDRPGVIFDFDDVGNMIGLEVLDASMVLSDPRRIEFSVG